MSASVRCRSITDQSGQFVCVIVRFCPCALGYRLGYEIIGAESPKQRRGTAWSGVSGERNGQATGRWLLCPLCDGWPVAFTVLPIEELAVPMAESKGKA